MHLQYLRSELVHFYGRGIARYQSYYYYDDAFFCTRKEGDGAISRLH